MWSSAKESLLARRSSAIPERFRARSIAPVHPSFLWRFDRSSCSCVARAAPRNGRPASECLPRVVVKLGPGWGILSNDSRDLHEMSLGSPSRIDPDAWLRPPARQPYVCGCYRVSRILAPVKRGGASPEVLVEYLQPHPKRACLCRRV